MLGDFVLGLQVLRSNLQTFSGVEGHHLGDYLDYVSKTLDKEHENEFKKLMADERFFLFDVGLTFMDKEHFASTPEFETACKKLEEARKRLYGMNAALLQAKR